jgi:hypothetical protein
MGRFHTWIDLAFRAPHRSDAGAAARRRKLAFECCESRLALSAATAALDDAIAIDNSAMINVLTWQSLVDSGSQLASRYDLKSNFPVDPEQLEAVIPSSPEGGVIGLDAIATSGTIFLRSTRPPISSTPLSAMTVSRCRWRHSLLSAACKPGRRLSSTASATAPTGICSKRAR